MAVIYLKHPDHGVKIATMDMEAEYDESNGWVRYNPEEPPIPDFLSTNELTSRRGKRKTED